MPRPICVKCQSEYYVHTVGVYVIEMARKPPEPYRIWAADQWQCRGCDTMILSGFSNKPVSVEWEDDWGEQLDRLVKLREHHPGMVIYCYEKPQLVKP